MVNRRLKWGLILGGWTLAGLFFTSQTYFQNSYFAYVYAQQNSAGSAIPWWQTLVWILTYTYIWAALTPTVMNFGARFRLGRRRWRQNLPVHLCIAVAFSLLHITIYTFVGYLLESLLVGKRTPLSVSFQYLFITCLHSNLFVYALIVGIQHLADYYQRYRAREVKASQMAARLTEAQLQVLRMQLQPHFLFNTLNAISTLIHKDAEAADRMLVRLGDLLRHTLTSSGCPQVSLKQEVELLERYLEIERIRFSDRLNVRLEIEPTVLEAQIPSFILQPLVENAIRHGIAPRAAAGTIEIRVRRNQDCLEVYVRDNGCGLPQEPAIKEGIGLTNTRALLQQLYGSQHRFKLSNAPEGGAVVELMIPFRAVGD